MRTKTLKNTLALLLAALALTFFAACSSEDDSDPDPAYCGTWKPTDDLITYLNAALQQAASGSEANEEEATQSDGNTNESEASDDQDASSSIQLSTSSISLTISSNSTIAISVYGIFSIPGSYTYSGSDTEGTFHFTLDTSDLDTSIAGMAQLIGSAFTGDGKSVTYATGSLSAKLDNIDTVIFTK